jgi:transketolase
MEIVLPGTAQEFDILFRQAYSNNKPTYYRLSERNNPESYDVKFGRAEVIKKGSRATVVAVGPVLKPVLEASSDLDVTVLYYTTVAPFDSATLRQNCASNKIIVCEPYYYGALTSDIIEAMRARSATIYHVGVPRVFLTNYGKAEEHDSAIGLTAHNIRKKIESLIKR